MPQTGRTTGSHRRAARYVAGGVVLGLALVLAVALLKSQTVDPHNSACASCHLGDPKTSGRNIAYDINRICLDCHARPDSTSHPVGMVPSMKVPEDLHLDRRGRLSCATCHDVHQQGAEGHARYPALLRRPQAGRPFCAACHRTIGTPNARILHSMMSASAHGKARLLKNDLQAGPIDEESRGCLGCHDGSVATGGETMAAQGGAWDHGGDVGITHPIGIRYAENAMRNRALVPVAELNPAIRLPGGMVGCGSCHDSFSTAKHQLVLDNTGSSLCLQCHRM
jgi:predicted CXXCH cytochrome family protein